MFSIVNRFVFYDYYVFHYQTSILSVETALPSPKYQLQCTDASKTPELWSYGQIYHRVLTRDENARWFSASVEIYQ